MGDKKPILESWSISLSHDHVTLSHVTVQAGRSGRWAQEGPRLVDCAGAGSGEAPGSEARSPNSLRGLCLPLVTAVPPLLPIMIQPRCLLASGRHLEASRPQPPPSHVCHPYLAPQGPWAGPGLLHPRSTSLRPPHPPPVACLAPPTNPLHRQGVCLRPSLCSSQRSSPHWSLTSPPTHSKFLLSPMDTFRFTQVFQN